MDPTTRRFLLLSSPAKRKRAGWEIVNGGLEAGETLLDGALREVAEEAGPDVRIDVVGTVHAWTYRYDDAVPHMLSVAFAATYLGGDVVAGDDMRGCEVRWATLDEVREVAEDDGTALIPEEAWLFERALDLIDRWGR